MDFAALPPEINSGRMYSGPGCESITAATAWNELAAELHATAAAYSSVISGLTSGPWLGPASISMAAAATTYVMWMRATASQASQAHAQARAVVAAYEAAHAMTVPPMVIAANRALLMSLIATNILGQNTPAIAATEAHYAEMWAQDAAAMYSYAGASAAASTLTPFTMPSPNTNPGGLVRQAAAVAQAAGKSAGTHAHVVMSVGPRLISAVPQVLQRLTLPAPTQGLRQIVTYLVEFGYVGAAIVGASMGTINAMNALFNASKAAMGAAAAGLSTAGTGAMGLAGLGAAPAISAGLGHATSIGALSVPPSWATAAPAAGSALSGARLGMTPAIPAGPAGMPGIPLAAGAGRGGSDPVPRYGIRPTVMARPVSAG